MASTSLLVSVAVLAAMAHCSLGRRHTSQGANERTISEELRGQRNESACPPDNSARVDQKGACVDENSAPVDADCCWCQTQLQEAQAKTLTRLTTYRKKCVKKQQIEQTQDGTVVVKDTSTICGDLCQALPLLQAPHTVDVAALEERCPNDKALENVRSMMLLVEAMDESWRSCSATGDGGGQEPVEECAWEYGDCTKSNCCRGPGLTCYQKDEYYAQCLTSCGEAAFKGGLKQHQGWTCLPLVPGPRPTTGGSGGSGQKADKPYGGAKNIVYVLQRAGGSIFQHWERCRYDKYTYAMISTVNEVLSLDSDSRINAIVYDNNPAEWSEALLPATRENKERFANFLKAQSGSEDSFALVKYWNYYANLDKALLKAFAVPGVEAVVLFSDGTKDDSKLDWTSLSAEQRAKVVPVYAKRLQTLSSPKGVQLLSRIAQVSKGKFYDTDELVDGCPRIVGDKFTVQGCGTEDVNGEWKWISTYNGRPSYERQVYHSPHAGQEWQEYTIQWDKEKWILTESVVWPLLSKTLYENRQDSDLVPVDGWQTVEGSGAAPRIVEYLGSK